MSYSVEDPATQAELFAQISGLILKLTLFLQMGKLPSNYLNIKSNSDGGTKVPLRGYWSIIPYSAIFVAEKTFKMKQRNYSNCQFYLSPVLILHRNKYTQEKLRILIKCPKVAFEMLSILSSKFFESLALSNQLLVGCRR